MCPGAPILMTVLLDMPAFAYPAMPMMRGLAIGSPLGHIIYGPILGVSFVMSRGTKRRAWLEKPIKPESSSIKKVEL